MTIRDLLGAIGNALWTAKDAILDATVLEVLGSVFGLGAFLVVLWISIFGHELRVARAARKRAKRDAPR